MTLKIIGIGQPLRGDDSAGLEIVRRWQDQHLADYHPEQVRVNLAESPGLNLLSLLGECSIAVLVDAVQSGAPPGTLHQIHEDQLAAFLEGTGSAHGWGAAETLRLGRMIGSQDLPDQIFILGIEIKQVDPGQAISLEIEQQIPRAVKTLNDLCRSLIT